MDGTEMINDLLKNIQVGKQTLVDVSKKMLDGKESIVFAVENRQVQPEQPQLPPKMESPKRAHVFHDVDGFAGYLAKYKTTDTVVLVDVSSLEVSAVLDERADKGFEVVTFRPVIHPLFEPWNLKLANEEPETLRSFVEFLTQNRRAVISPESKSLILMLSQVKVSRKVTLQRGFGKHSINGLVCEMDIAGQSKSEELAIPDTIKIKTPIFLATDPVEIEIDITIDADDHQVYVKCTSSDLLQKQVELFDAMLSKVRVIPEVVVALGCPEHQDWKYLCNPYRA